MSFPVICVTPATAADAVWLIQTRAACLGITNDQEVFDTLARGRAESWWIARPYGVDGRFGYVRWLRQEAGLVVAELAVAPAYRDHGVGLRLLQKAQESAELNRMPIAATVHVQPEVTALFRKAGFKACRFHKIATGKDCISFLWEAKREHKQVG